jgi:hypothetical protein
MGDFVPDSYYGNEPNPEPPNPGSGTLPSQSPRPKVTLPDGTVVDGNSWGVVQSGAIKDALQRPSRLAAVCWEQQTAACRMEHDLRVGR